MQPPRSDNVFLLTLVDFLVQIIFFGLFVFVVHQAVIQKENRRYDRQSVDRAIEAAGVSNITELTDQLSRLAPVGLKGLNASLGDKVQASDLKDASEAIKKAGGAAGLNDAMARLAKLEQGTDLPPCIWETVDGERRATTLATVTGSGSALTFDGPTPELSKLLAEVGLSFSAVRSLGLREFPRVLQPILSKHPKCRFTIVLRETTQMVGARDSAQQIFYTRIRH